VLAEQRPEIKASAELAEQRGVAPSWWRVELRGAHLVGWIALAMLLTLAVSGWHAPDWLLPPVWATMVCAMGAKLVFWLLYSLTNPSARLPRLRFYRWWARGPLPVGLALLPGLFVLACVLPQALK
jgi:hypothetical protein